jgi:hypothetical protein
MAFRDFSFPEVKSQLGLRTQDADLFSSAAPASVREEFAAVIRDGTALALANSTEKAKSEFIIAPILLELKRSIGQPFALFSGVEWNVDASRGLNGYCDFLIGRGSSQYVLEAPFVAIVEAKNDLIRTGLGQCIAAMSAAWLTNEREARPVKAVHGVVTTGSAWKFLRLSGDLLTLDVSEYFIDNLPKIMGILRQIVEAT